MSRYKRILFLRLTDATEDGVDEIQRPRLMEPYFSLPADFVPPPSRMAGSLETAEQSGGVFIMIELGVDLTPSRTTSDWGLSIRFRRVGQ